MPTPTPDFLGTSASDNPNFLSIFIKKISSSLVDAFKKALPPKSCYISSLPEIFNKTGAFKNFEKLIEKHMFLSLIFIKVAAWGATTLSKKDAGEICDIFQNTSLKEHVWVTASIVIA